MTTLEVLKLLLDEKCDKLFKYSANFLMTTPKAGCEHIFRHTREIVVILGELIEDMEGKK